MKCAHCGNEIPLGSVYCKHCGKAAQIVPDYNLLEDDVLPQILEEKEKKRRADEKRAGVSGVSEACESVSGKAGSTPEKKDSPVAVAKKLWRNPKTRWACICSTILVILLVAGICLWVTNSYGFQLQAGKRLDGKEDYRNALTHYLRAVELDDEAVEAKVGAGLDYYQLGEYDEAWDILMEAVEADPANVEAFRCLLAICCEQDDYDEIERLQRMAEGHDAQQLFDEYLVAGPGFSFDEGTYDDDLQLELTSGNGNTVYYTLDGTDPIRRGQLYREPILLTDGETTVKAAAKNSDGIYSRVVEKTYRISYKKPEYPTVSPMQGEFHEPTYVTITAEEGSSVYYTWDGSVPTASSARYTDPLLIPQGNHVLSILVIDRHGLCSDILRCNYIYMP